MESQSSTEGPQRRKLNLKPRDESAASKAETERKSARAVRVTEHERLHRTLRKSCSGPAANLLLCHTAMRYNRACYYRILLEQQNHERQF